MTPTDCLSFFFSSRRRHTRWPRDWSSDVCSSDLSGSTDTQTRGHHWWTWIVWNRVAVNGDANLVQEVFCLLAIHLRVAQVSKNQVHVSADSKHVNDC